MESSIIKVYNWSKIYKNVQDMAKIPGTSYVKDSGSQFVFRDMLVELDEVLDTVSKASNLPKMVFVYADVVRLPAKRNWILDNMGLFIAARRIEATTGKFFQFNYLKRGNTASFVVYATEVEGVLKVKAFTSPDPKQEPVIYDLSQFDKLGVQIACQNNVSERKDLTYIGEEALELGKELWMSLSCIFQFATVLFDSKPDIAGAMLKWIKAITAPSTISRDMYLQSSALLSQLMLSASKVNFVPYLSKKVYEDVASGFEDAALQYEVQYNMFRQEKKDKERWIASANQMQHYFQLTSKFNQQLIAQAKDNLKNAQQAVDEAARRLKWQKLMVDRAAIMFETGIKIWKEDQILKAVFSICMALVEFGAMIAEMAAGDEAAGASAGKAVADAGKAAGDAAKAGGKAANMAKKMSNLYKIMMNLKNTGKTLISTYKMIKTIVDAAQKFESVSKFDDMAAPTDNDISCQEEWDIFRLEVDNMLKSVIEEDIEGAPEYNEELDKLAIYGKALSANQASLIQIAQELARLYMQKQISDKMQDSLDQYVKKLEDGIKPDEVMMHLLYVRGLNIKRWMFIAIQNYTRAYRYWALRESMVLPSIVKSVPELKEDLAKTKQDYADALESFNPPPQDFGSRGLGKVFEITNEVVLEELKKKKEAHIVVPLHVDTFEGFDRVRLTTIRVWLHGVKAKKPIYIDIANSGAYYDRFQGKTFRFTSLPLDRRFQYQGEPGNKKGIQVDGNVADEEKYAYFQPTPFSEWLISLPEKLNAGIDLSGLTKITMAFAGSVIGGLVGQHLASHKS